MTIAFPSINVWLTHIISSLYKKLKLITSLYAILHTANVISYTQFHESRLEKSRINKVDPKDRLLKGENI